MSGTTKKPLEKLGEYSRSKAYDAAYPNRSLLGDNSPLSEEIRGKLKANCKPLAGKMQAFLEKSQARFKELKGTEFNGSISLKQLLGKELLKLYKEAIAEEYASEAFLETMLQQTYVGGRRSDGVPIRDVVSGITGIGKTRNGIQHFKETAERLDQHLPEPAPAPEDTRPCFIIDGGNEREVSQMRNLVISMCTTLCGTVIDDVEDYKPKQKLKEQLEEVLTSEKSVDLLILDTLAHPLNYVGQGKVQDLIESAEQWFEKGFHVAHLEIKVDPEKKAAVLENMRETGTARAALQTPPAPGVYQLVLNREDQKGDNDESLPTPECKGYDQRSAFVAEHASAKFNAYLLKKDQEFFENREYDRVSTGANIRSLQDSAPPIEQLTPKKIRRHGAIKQSQESRPKFTTQLRRMKSSSSSLDMSSLSSSSSLGSSLATSSSTSSLPSVESVIEIKVENVVIELTPKIIESLFKGLDTTEKIQEKVKQLSGLITEDLNSASDKKERMKSYTALYRELQNANPPVDKAILTAFAKAIAAHALPEARDRAALLMRSGGQAIEAQVKQDLEVVKVDTLLKRQDFLNEAKALNDVLNPYTKDIELESRPLQKVILRDGEYASETETEERTIHLDGGDPSESETDGTDAESSAQLLAALRATTPTPPVATETKATPLNKEEAKLIAYGLLAELKSIEAVKGMLAKKDEYKELVFSKEDKASIKSALTTLRMAEIPHTTSMEAMEGKPECKAPQFAKIISDLMIEAYRKDYHTLVTSGNSNLYPNTVDLFSKVNVMVVDDICSASSKKEQKAKLLYYVDVLMELKKLKNSEACYAIGVVLADCIALFENTSGKKIIQGEKREAVEFFKLTQEASKPGVKNLEEQGMITPIVTLKNKLEFKGKDKKTWFQSIGKSLEKIFDVSLSDPGPLSTDAMGLNNHLNGVIEKRNAYVQQTTPPESQRESEKRAAEQNYLAARKLFLQDNSTISLLNIEILLSLPADQIKVNVKGEIKQGHKALLFLEKRLNEIDEDPKNSQQKQKINGLQGKVREQILERELEREMEFLIRTQPTGYKETHAALMKQYMELFDKKPAEKKEADAPPQPASTPKQPAGGQAASQTGEVPKAFTNAFERHNTKSKQPEQPGQEQSPVVAIRPGTTKKS